MTKIMHAGILGPDLIGDLLEVKIDPLRLEMVTDFVGEDQSFAVLRFIPPGFLCIADISLSRIITFFDSENLYDDSIRVVS